MGVRLASVGNTVIVASPAGAGETIIATTGPINLVVDNAQVLLFWYFNVTAGTNCTSINPRVRRGITVSDTLVNRVAGITVVAASVYANTGVYVDTPGVAAEIQYCLTLVCTAATAASNINDVCLMAMVL